MVEVTICSDFGAQENKVWHCFHCFPIYFPWVMGPDAMIFVFWMLSFKPTFSLLSFTFIKRLFSFSSFSAIRVVSLPLGGHGNPLQYSCLENPHRHRSVAGYSPWHCKELDATQQLSTAQQSKVILYSMGVGRVKLIFITTINGV